MTSMIFSEIISFWTCSMIEIHYKLTCFLALCRWYSLTVSSFFFISTGFHMIFQLMFHFELKFCIKSGLERIFTRVVSSERFWYPFLKNTVKDSIQATNRPKPSRPAPAPRPSHLVPSQQSSGPIPRPPANKAPTPVSKLPSNPRAQSVRGAFLFQSRTDFR